VVFSPFNDDATAASLGFRIPSPLAAGLTPKLCGLDYPSIASIFGNLLDGANFGLGTIAKFDFHPPISADRERFSFALDGK
jgi:hypothetical protein